MDSLQTVDVYDEKSERKVNVQELEKYLCPLCKCILADPVQITECGHRCCRDCVKGETLIACPACHVVLNDATQVRRRIYSYVRERCFTDPWCGTGEGGQGMSAGDEKPQSQVYRLQCRG